MADTPLSREQYVQKVLETYQHTPGTSGQVRPPDRLLAMQLQQRGIPLHTIENALVLAAARRIYLSSGFTLIAEQPHHSFGVDLVGQTYQAELASLADQAG